MTSEMLAQKGVGYVLVKVASKTHDPTLVCVFLTHAQAEIEGRQVRMQQFAQIYQFILEKLKILKPRRCIVMLAGDFNVNGLLTDDTAEYEEMMQTLHRPTDLYRMVHPIEDRLKAITNEGVRLDYIFVYPPRVGLQANAIDIINCTVYQDWIVQGTPVSDHHPVVAYFRIPVFKGKSY